MDPLESIASGFRKYLDYRGRASRPEFWWWFGFVLAYYLGGLLLLGGANLFSVWVLGILVLFPPTLMVSIRRLHDRGRSGWWYLLGVVPFGAFVLLYWYALAGDPGENKYGIPPA